MALEQQQIGVISLEQSIACKQVPSLSSLRMLDTNSLQDVSCPCNVVVDLSA